MADFGSLNVRVIDVEVMGHITLGTIVPAPETIFDQGSFTARLIGGAGGAPIVIEVPTVIPAPPSTHGIGDWPMRFFPPQSHIGELEPDTAGEPNSLYMCPDNSVDYIRYFEIINRSASSRTVKLFFGDAANPFEQINQALPAGSSIISGDAFMFDIGQGEEILGSASGPGVICNISGVEEVQS
jgi:hypothetical protein